MKNPFAMMALMAATMAAAFRENAFRDAGMALPGGGGKSRAPGKRNPAGTKQILRFYKAKHGTKAPTVEEALAWYRAYHADKDAAVRHAEQQRKARRTNFLKAA